MRLPNTRMTSSRSGGVSVMRSITCIFTFCFLCMGTASFAANDTSQQFGKWMVSSAPSGAGESLTLSLKAEKEVKGWMKSYVPILTIQCNQGKASVYIEAGMPLEVTQVDQQVVHVQFDGNKLITQRWREVTNATMSARDATALIKQLAQSQKFIFEFTPFGSKPAQAEFAVAGLAAYLPQLAGACWKK
jgi:hypothetical protein